MSPFSGFSKHKSPSSAERTAKRPARPGKGLLKLLFQWKAQLLCVLAGALLFFLSAAYMQPDGNLQHGRFLKRQFYGGETQSYRIHVEGLFSEPLSIDVPVSPRSYKEDEIQSVFEECMNKLSLQILGENASAAEIRSDLTLPSFMEEYGLYISWTSSDPELLGVYGNLHNENLKLPQELSLTAHLYDAGGKFEADYELPLTVHPRSLSPAEERKEDFLQFLRQADEEQAFSENLALPSEYQGSRLSYRENTEQSSWIFLVLGVLSAVLLFLRDRQNEGKNEKLRQRQMLLDYPEIVSKLMVFIGAGMTIRLAWANIVQDYESDREKQQTPERHHAYEAMAQALAKLKTGANEGKVYHEFGRDCKLRQYMKLSGILEQNRKNGIANIRHILSAEMEQAWEERKNLARRLGEEAGTKLLGPLFIMLLIVMVMIIVPAMLSF